MKKIVLSFIALGILSTMSFAQVAKDISVAIDAPVAGTTIEVGVPLDFTFTVTNSGTVDLVVTDSVFYGFFIGGQNLFGTSILLSDRANGTVAPGGSWTTTFPGLNFSTINLNGANDMCVRVFLFEGAAASPTIEADTLNNENCRSFNFVMGSTAGLEDGVTAGAASVNAYPNPAQDEVRFEVTGIDAERIELTNVAGQVVLELEVDEAVNMIDVSHLEAGVYMYSLYTSKGKKTAKKLMIK